VRRFDRFRSEPVYNTRAVVQRTGVPADTFRAWERRYGLPSPNRSAGNQRLYSERDVAVIGWLRDQTKVGLTISQAVALYRVEENGATPRETSGIVATSRSGGEVGTAVPGRLGEFRDRVAAALTGFDGEGADRVVEDAMALIAVHDVCLHVLEAALVEVGERWRRGEVGVGAEHFASCFVMRKLAALFNLSQPQSGRGPIVAACVEGELHEIGLLLTSLFLSRHGFKIVYLGANLPLVDLVAVVRQVQPPLVLLSATVETHLGRLIEATEALRGTMVGYGGRMFVDRPELCDGVEGVYLGDDARVMVERVERMLAHMRPRVEIAQGAPG
jgi:MerR family transcriptional regulator, light-induced transcriptional regulator